MNTNLVASILVYCTTNTTEVQSDFAGWRSVHNPKAGYTLVGLIEGINPQGKLVTTTAKKVSVLTFEWLGQKHSVTNEQILDSKTIHFMQTNGWTEVK